MFLAKVALRSGDEIVSVNQAFKNLLSDNAYTGSDLVLRDFAVGSSIDSSFDEFNNWLNSCSFQGATADYWGRCRAKVLGSNIEVYNFVESVDPTNSNGTQLVFGQVTVRNGKIYKGTSLAFVLGLL